MAREYINREDMLNTGREKLNRSIDKSYDAEKNSKQSLEDANRLGNEAKQISTDKGNEAISIANKKGNESIAIAKENEKISKEGNLIAKDTNDRMNQIIGGETDSAEIIDARKPLGEEAHKTIGERMNYTDVAVYKNAIDVRNYDNLRDCIKRNGDSEVKISLFNYQEVLTGNFQLPGNVTLVFEGSSYLTFIDSEIKISGKIVAGRNKIFELKNSEFVSSDVSMGNSSNSMNYDFVVMPEWFGAVSDAYMSRGFNSVGQEVIAYGTDSSEAFRTAMSFCEAISNKYHGDIYSNVPTVRLELAKGSQYYCKGNNIFGIQSDTPNIGYHIAFDGNSSSIFWEPEDANDALFDKYSRVRNPEIKNFRVILVLEPFEYKGIFIRSKTFQKDVLHFWTLGIFEKIDLHLHEGRSGFLKVFDLETDDKHSHDDMTIVRNLNCSAFKIFMDIKNKESVSWKFEKCFLGLTVSESIAFKIADGFSGGLIIDSCEFLLQGQKSTILEVGENSGLTPVNITNCRVETRERTSNNFIPFKIKSGLVNVDGLLFESGGSDNGISDQTYMAVIGIKARMNFRNCGIIGAFLLESENKRIASNDTALHFFNCFFYYKDKGYGFPIYYIKNSDGSIIDYQTAIAIGLYVRSITTESSRINSGGFNYDFKQASTSIESNSQILKISNGTSSGHSKLNISYFELPLNSYIESAKIYLSNVNTTKCNLIEINIVEEGNKSSAKMWKELTNNNRVYGSSVLAENNILTTKNKCYLEIKHLLNGQLVSDVENMPYGWLEIKLTSMNKAQDLARGNKVSIRNIFD